MDTHIYWKLVEADFGSKKVFPKVDLLIMFLKSEFY